MHPPLTDGPVWAGREINRIRGLFPLSIEQHINAKVSDLVPSVTTVTNVARSYALHALVLSEANRRKLDEEQTRQLLRRAEVVLAVASEAHRDSPDHHAWFPAAHGAVKVSHFWRDGYYDLAGATADTADAYAKPAWGFQGVYIAPLMRLGIIGRDGAAPEAAADHEALWTALEPTMRVALSDSAVIAMADVESLGSQCVCLCGNAPDGEWLAERLLGDPSRPETLAGQLAATMQLIALAVERGHVRNEADVADFIAFSPDWTDWPSLVSHRTAHRWRGVALRNLAVGAWRQLWSELSKRAATDGRYVAVEDLTGWLAQQMPDATVADFMRSLPGTMESTQPLAAERHCGESDWSPSLVAISQALLSGQRSRELDPVELEGYMGNAFDTEQELSPIWVRRVTRDWTERPMAEFARYLVGILLDRAQRVSLNKARFEGGRFTLPARVVVRDGFVIWHDVDAPDAPPLRLGQCLHVGGQVGIFSRDGDGLWHLGERGRDLVR